VKPIMKNFFKPLAVMLMAVGAATGVGAQPLAPMIEATPIAVYAAGSLRVALTVIAKDFEVSSGQKTALTFGASGLLRERIEKGEAAQVFASADTDHPQRLATKGGWQAPKVFVRNSLCALTNDKLETTPANLLATLLRPDVRLGSSTPKADPSGDYTWEMFRKADALKPGAFATLGTKAQQLVGKVDSPKPPEGRLAYAWIVDKGDVDVFLTYCTNAVAAQQEVPRLKVVQLPPELQVGAAYGFTVRADAPPAAAAFANALLVPKAQAVFSKLGFGQP
jgi:molybdenum ABC transporter molybdate-binding protein